MGGNPPPYQTHLFPLQPLDACRENLAWARYESTIRTSEPLLRRLPTKLVSGGGASVALPLSVSIALTEDSDSSPPLGQLDEAGSPSPSVFVLPVPGLPEFRRGPRPALVRSSVIR